MEKDEYVKCIKQLLKTYHPDLCKDENLREMYNDITVKLNITLNKLENKEVTLNESLIEDKNFNIFSFRYYFSKVQSIGINKNSIKNKNFIIFRNFLISEINKDDSIIGGHLTFLLSNENIQNSSIDLFVNAYANYNSMFQNYYQYKENNLKQCIKIAESYFKDYIKKSGVKNIETMIKETEKWLQSIVEKIYKQQRCA